MPEQHDFESRLSDAMRRYADRAPTDVDASALAREIAESPVTRGRLRPRWWPFGRHDTSPQEPPRRSSIMSIALGTAAVAIVAVGAGYALVGGPEDGADQTPAAITTDSVGDDWAFFEGTLTYDGVAVAGLDPVDAEVINGLVVQREVGYRDQTLTTSDPRMTGRRTESSNTYTDFAGANGVPGAIWANASVIEADGGSWSCQLNGVSSDELTSEAGWCTGAEGFEGMRAFVVVGGGAAAAGRSVPTWGYITAAEGPPLPGTPPIE